MLSDKVSSLKHGKLCSVVFDETVLKEGLRYNEEKDYVEGVEDLGDQRTYFVANHATVFRLEVASWLFFVKRPYQWWSAEVMQCINHVTGLGLEVKQLSAIKDQTMLRL